MATYSPLYINKLKESFLSKTNLIIEQTKATFPNNAAKGDMEDFFAWHYFKRDEMTLCIWRVRWKK